jgi:tetratricopeptide (TPR) repeat protein
MKRNAVGRLAPLIACAACAHALRTPPPLESIAPPPQAGAAQLLARADEAWSRRADLAQAGAAEQLYLEAARADPRNAAAYAGAVRAKAFRIGREKDGDKRGQLAADAVAVGQLCEGNAAPAALCDYWLAAALGLQARERSATGHDALPHMVDLLHRAAAADPSVDGGGPHRLLAILLLRAPGWPLGPGDVEAALPEAQAAARIAPDYPPNQLAAGEALRKNGRAAEARAAYAEALRLAGADTDPDAKGWADEARAALR